MPKVYKPERPLYGTDVHSPYVQSHQPTYVANPLWIPWGYKKDKDDPTLFFPDFRALSVLEKAFKYVWAGGTFESAAIWISHHSGYDITKPTVSKKYRQWMQFKAKPLYENRNTMRKLKKQEMEKRLGRNIAAKGIREDKQDSQEKEAIKNSSIPV